MKELHEMTFREFREAYKVYDPHVEQKIKEFKEKAGLNWIPGQSIHERALMFALKQGIPVSLEILRIPEHVYPKFAALVEKLDLLPNPYKDLSQ